MWRTFSLFVSLHSFLIGLFPFYIPVYLYAGGISLVRIAVFIALTGVGYCFTLFFWERLSGRVSLRHLLAFSFLSELILLSLFCLPHETAVLYLAGITNGIFNCCFWTIQRLLFLERVGPANSGRKFGSFQIYVAVALKAAVFVGGVLLEASGFSAVYLLSAVVAVLGGCLFFFSFGQVELTKDAQGDIPLSLPMITKFTDNLRSKWIFAIDGLFLYLESYFWLISLYLIVDESFSRLGVLVVALTLGFGVVFVFIKNSIDRLPVDNIYRAAVFLYALSWGLRSVVSDQLAPVALLVLLALITFFTSLFRLIFNKRFFDIAKAAGSPRYIFLKSYYSQFFLLVLPALALMFFSAAGNPAEELAFLYLCAASLAPVYLLYRACESLEEKEVTPPAIRETAGLLMPKGSVSDFRQNPEECRRE